MKTSFLIPGAALAIGLGVGFGIGKSGDASESETAAIEASMRTSKSDRGGMDSSRGSKNEKKARSLDEIYRQPGQSNRVQSLLDFYSNLGPGEFSAEADKLEALPFNERILAGVLLFGKWAEVDPTAAMAYTDTMGFGGALVRPTVLQGWASTDPVNAAKYYSENPAQFAMMNMMGGGRGGMGAQGPAEIIAGEWAKQDPTAAMAWASALPNNSSGAMSTVISEVAKSDPMKAATMAGGMPEDARGQAYESIAKQWAQKDFSEAASWVAGLPEGERVGAMSAAIEGLAISNPALAATELGKMTDLEARADVAPIVAKNYARTDVQGSITWLNTLDDEAKRESMREVMPIWAASDSAAALNFIKSQTAPEVKDRAAESYIWSNRSTPPAQLVEVAGMISDEGNRSRASGVVAARWMQEDKAAATDYINSTQSIPAEMKERLLNGQSMWGNGRSRGR
ncbi:MAG: hypothetical protein V4727_04895 [Verrucomicrobiota bacterium]